MKRSEINKALKELEVMCEKYHCYLPPCCHFTPGEYTIHNEYLTVKIHEKGATLWSIKDRAGTEYLWQGNPKYWADRAPNIFPYVARLTGGKYILQDKTYKMDIHGFAKDILFEAEQVSESHIVFSISDTTETYKQYPYKFRFWVDYQLEENKLLITYIIRNEDDKIMYFGLGGHPGFNVPFEENTVFEDYYLEFDAVHQVEQVELSDEKFVTGVFKTFPLDQGMSLHLRHGLFKDGAIVLRNMAHCVTLKTELSQKEIRVEYPDMAYLGIWHVPNMNAPYICIEPWSSLPSRQGIVEDLETQPGLISLTSKCEYHNQFSIQINV